MKNFKLCAVLLVVLVVLSLCFASCADKPKVVTLENLQLPKLSQDEMVVVEKVGERQYKCFTVPLVGQLTEQSSLLDVLQYIQNTFDVTLELSNGFINKFDQLPHANVANEYVYLYTSVQKDFDTSAWVEEFDCDGVTVKTSAVGCAEMSVQKGCVIYISTVIFG